MSSIVDPMEALSAFQPALRSGQITVQRGEVDPDLFLHFDKPGGQPRYTYCRMDGPNVTAIAIICLAQPNEGLPVFQIGYAVPEHLRGQGRAKDVSAAALADLRSGMRRHGLKEFFFEAIVGADNIASQQVAKAIVGGEATPITEHESGEPALQYMTRITA